MRQVDRAQVPDLPDRIIAATALHLGLPLISRDRKIQLADVETIWGCRKFLSGWHRPVSQVALLLTNLPQLEWLLREGSIVVFDRGRVRVRRLPIGGK